MSNKTLPPAAAVLLDVRRLLLNPAHWCQGDQSIDAWGGTHHPWSAHVAKRCLLGALNARPRPLPHIEEAFNILGQTVAQEEGYSMTDSNWRCEIADYNDNHSHTQVIGLIDRAIARSLRDRNTLK